MTARTKKRYREVVTGETFNQAGFFWTVVEVTPNGRKFWAETPLEGRAPMRREFSAEIGAMYYGEPDRGDDGEES
jgi:hypothetical protein